MHETLKQTEAVSDLKEHLEATNKRLLERVRGLENENWTLRENSRVQEQREAWKVGRGKENGGPGNGNQFGSKFQGKSNGVRMWHIEAISQASFIKFKRNKHSGNVNKNLSLFLEDEETEESKKDLFIPKFEHEEKMNLAILNLRKEHVKEKRELQRERDRREKDLQTQLQKQLHEAKQNQTEDTNKSKQLEQLKRVRKSK